MNEPPVLHCFWDMADYILCHFGAQKGMPLLMHWLGWNCIFRMGKFGHEKLETSLYRMETWTVQAWPTSVTDRQTDRQTYRLAESICCTSLCCCIIPMSVSSSSTNFIVTQVLTKLHGRCWVTLGWHYCEEAVGELFIVITDVIRMSHHRRLHWASEMTWCLQCVGVWAVPTAVQQVQWEWTLSWHRMKAELSLPYLPTSLMTVLHLSSLTDSQSVQVFLLHIFCLFSCLFFSVRRR